MGGIATWVQRDLQPEWMDQPDLADDLHRQALDGLRRINAVSFAGAIFWPSLHRLAAEHADRPLRVLDLACGGGDVAVDLARRARLAGTKMQFLGCDKSALAVSCDQRLAAARQAAQVEFRVLDVLSEPLPTGYDVVTCSLFLHHLDDSQAVALLRRMAEAAGRLVLVNDLRRTRLGYGLAWTVTRLLTRSPVIQLDGPQSVAAAFTMREALDLAERAGLAGARINRRWPQRFLLTWRRP